MAPAVRGWRVCRFHGAGGGAAMGEAHWNFKHGLRAADYTERRKLSRRILSQAKNIIAEVD